MIIRNREFINIGLSNGKTEAAPEFVFLLSPKEAYLVGMLTKEKTKNKPKIFGFVDRMMFVNS